MGSLAAGVDGSLVSSATASGSSGLFSFFSGPKGSGSTKRHEEGTFFSPRTHPSPVFIPAKRTRDKAGTGLLANASVSLCCSSQHPSCTGWPCLSHSSHCANWAWLFCSGSLFFLEMRSFLLFCFCPVLTAPGSCLVGENSTRELLSTSQVRLLTPGGKFKIPASSGKLSKWVLLSGQWLVPHDKAKELGSGGDCCCVGMRAMWLSFFEYSREAWNLEFYFKIFRFFNVGSWFKRLRNPPGQIDLLAHWPLKHALFSKWPIWVGKLPQAMETNLNNLTLLLAPVEKVKHLGSSESCVQRFLIQVTCSGLVSQADPLPKKCPPMPRPMSGCF